MKYKFLFLFIFIIVFAGCIPSNSAETPSPTALPKYELFILKKSMVGCYKYEDFLSGIKKTDEKDISFTIAPSSIETYDWDTQTIILTEKGTNDLIASLPEDKELSDLALALKKMEKSLGWGNPVEQALYSRAFLVKINGELLYGGMFLNAVSQMAIDYPVIRVEIIKSRVAFHILPIHIPFVMIDPVDEKGNIRKVPITQEAKEDVQNLDKNDKFFTKWMTDLATSQNAVKFRKIIRDERIRKTI